MLQSPGQGCKVFNGLQCVVAVSDMYAMVYKLYSIISFELFLSSLVLVVYLFDEEDL
jgi:hypothetical protein